MNCRDAPVLILVLGLGPSELDRVSEGKNRSELENKAKLGFSLQDRKVHNSISAHSEAIDLTSMAPY